ncbi:hypothetical protein ACFQ5J_03055 [Lacticaseibacillus baoqingensis]|uniref:Uncharacterized protein n=1 Tax=Lacticaseibacillus baoqingensis TaxID=2486013 RepID=A0ABW4E2Q3_9LACO|nr:hypothetical protein [Lacticaseibacillus baoqingensis]
MRHKTRWLLVLAAGVLVLSLGWYGYFHTGRRANLDGTNTQAALTTQKQFDQRITTLYPHLKPALDHDAKPDTSVIPGLLATKTLTLGAHAHVGISKTMDPQGLALTPNYLVISAYSRDKHYHSVLYFLDKHTGRLVKQIVLPSNSHVGGLAFDPVSKRLWITTETVAKKASLSAYDAATWQQADFAQHHTATKFDHVITMPNVLRASFITYHNNALYLGFFDKNAQGNFLALPMTKRGLPENRGGRNVVLRGDNQLGHFATSKRLQGATFYHGELLFSQSYGPNPSNLLVFDNDGQRTWLDFDGDDTLKTVTMPPYMEQIAADGEDLYVLFESASAKYRQADLEFHADRVVKLDLGQLLH